MNSITVSHYTSVKQIRQTRNNPEDRQLINSIKEMLRSRTITHTEKIDILVDNINKVTKNWRFNYHIKQSALPKKSTIKIDKNIYITCPELTVCHLAQHLCFEYLSLLVLELCGNYTINPYTKEFSQTAGNVTNVAKLSKYFEHYKTLNPNAKGINKLRKILDFAEDNSASPMESRLFIKLCAPRKYGLYGCKNLKMNTPIKLSTEASLIAGQKIVIPDIASLEKKIAIEYDSKEFHENSVRDQKDKRRRDALVHDGWKVHTILPSHINNTYTFDVIAKSILHDLGQSNRIRIRNFKQIQYNAFQKLK